MSRRKRKAPRWLQQPLYLAIRSMIGAMMCGSLEANLRTARGFGRRYAAFEKKRFARTMHTLGVAFPDMPEDERRERTFQAYEHLFTLGIEMIYTPRLLTTDGWAEYVRVGDLAPAMDALTCGRPCVMVASHCGNWELLGFTLALIGFPVHALYRPLDLPPMDQWVRQTRQRRGLRLVDKFGASVTVPALMRSGAHIGVIADQNAGDRGLFVPFFNRLASTYKSVGLMAMRFDAPIVCGQARRLVWERDAGHEGDEKHLERDASLGFGKWNGEPFRYRLDVVDVINPEDWKDQPDPLFYISARYRRAIEDMVRRAPEQNLWLHRYWKSRPRHERLGRPFPRSLREKIRQLPWITDDDMGRIEDWSARDARALAAGVRHDAPEAAAV